ncbi:MAG: hypothetical protein KDI65_07695 [Alphaproteobacteria bacterium]|nr:hypothetical protein [Alphaproteobacteria bacterium]
MTRRTRTVFLALALLLSGCASLPDEPPQEYYADKKIPVPSGDEFTFCSQYGCKLQTPLSFSAQDWADIYDFYGSPAQDAAGERAKIAQTIGFLERKIGPRTGTDKDIAGTFRKIGKGQLDCVDESTNTTTYLLLMDGKGLLKFHTVGSPDTRFPIIHAGRWPHQTAVIIDKETKIPYAVDSWFHDNGYPAEIITLESWKEGWKPDDLWR